MNRAAIGYLILTLAVVGAFYASYENDQRIEQARIERLKQLNVINTSQCRSLQNLYTVIRKSLRDADAAIDELAYYRQYPAERKRAHQRNTQTLDMFKTPPCPANFTIKPS